MRVLFRLIWGPCAWALQGSDLRISLLTGAGPCDRRFSHTLLLTSLCTPECLCYISISI